jgi:uncharacterized protein YbjQ (UPF0145 family)
MITTTLDGVAGRMTEETLGVVRGTAMWTRRITKTSMGGIRHMHANTMADFDEGLNAAKETATKALEAQGAKLGADAIVGLRLEVAEMSSGVFCINATGTAVKTSKLPQSVPLPPPAPEVDPFSQPADDFEFDMGLGVALYAARASYEGSVLRH